MRVLVVALPDLSLRLSKYVVGSVGFVTSTKDGKQLRHRVHEHQPDVVLLDYRMGGSGWRAIDEVPALVERTASRPDVIVLLPWKDTDVDRSAAKLGCYDVVSVDGPCFDQDVSDAVQTALKSRESRQMVRHLRRDDLH